MPSLPPLVLLFLALSPGLAWAQEAPPTDPEPDDAAPGEVSPADVVPGEAPPDNPPVQTPNGESGAALPGGGAGEAPDPEPTEPERVESTEAPRLEPAPVDTTDSQPSGAGAATGEHTEEAKSFGGELDLLGLTVSWSGYGDTQLTYQHGGTFTFDAYHFNPILGARLDEKLWAELEMEFEHGGSETKIEYALLDYTPHPALTVRIGKFLVPVGEFNDTWHPSFRWVQVSRPAMARTVVPAVWSDVGVQALGKVDIGPGRELGYNVFISNGLGGDPDPTNPSTLREMRGNVVDLNLDKAFGGRLRAKLGKGAYVGETTISVSGTTSLTEAGGGDRASIGAVDLHSKLGSVQFLGEFAMAYLGEESEALTPYGRGAYLQAFGRFGRFTPALRYDLAATALGTPGETVTQQGVATCMVSLATFWNLRGEVMVPFDRDGTGPATLEAMSAFYF